MSSPVPPSLTKENQHRARFIVMVVRNAMEEFDCQHLSDEQMRELNPIIRNAIATALHAFDHYERSRAAHDYVERRRSCLGRPG